jgi:hypothetical protein
MHREAAIFNSYAPACYGMWNGWERSNGGRIGGDEGTEEIRKGMKTTRN